MSPKRVRNVVIYVRISLSREESVSLQRQEEAARQYAASRGWTVVAVHADDGVNASKNRPEDRDGWRRVLATTGGWDAVVVWKLDRLSRRLADFWRTYLALEAEGKAIVSVSDSLDMTTAIGRTVASVLAGFAEMEAEAISARVTAARAHLLANGRYPGGRIPYGWRKTKNPYGPGWVIEQDPDRIEWVRAMVERTQAGRTLYSTAAWLNEQGAPTARGGPWKANTVENLVRHPIVAGLTPAGGDNADRKKGRGGELLRGTDGLPLVDQALALLPLPQWRAMVASLDAPQDGRRMPRAMRATTSGVLSGLMWCGEHRQPVRMWRGTTQGRPSYSCPECHQTLSAAEPLVVEDVLATWGEAVMWSRVEEVHQGASALLPEIAQRLAEMGAELVKATGDRVPALLAEMGRLKERQAEVEALPSRVEHVETGPVRPVLEAWEAAEDDEQRHDVMAYCLDQVLVRRGAKGAWTEAQKRARLTYEWSGRMGEPAA